MNQIATAPLVVVQRMSLLPSPLMSPIPATFHVAVGTVPRFPTPMMVPPFMSHTTRTPLVCCHRMSPMPSPLKSPVPTTLQLGGMLPRLADERIDVPFMNQIAVFPLESRHSQS